MSKRKREVSSQPLNKKKFLSSSLSLNDGNVEERAVDENVVRIKKKAASLQDWVERVPLDCSDIEKDEFVVKTELIEYSNKEMEDLEEATLPPVFYIDSDDDEEPCLSPSSNQIDAQTPPTLPSKIDAQSSSTNLRIKVYNAETKDEILDAKLIPTDFQCLQSIFLRVGIQINTDFETNLLKPNIPIEILTPPVVPSLPSSSEPSLKASSEVFLKDGTKLKSPKVEQSLKSSSLLNETTKDLEIVAPTFNKDSTDFFERVLVTYNAQEVASLNETLQNVPLAFTLSMAYINAQKNCSKKGQSYGIREYLKDYGVEAKRIPGSKIRTRSKKNESTILTSWNLCAHKIRSVKRIGPAAIQMLRALAYLHPEGISLQYFKEILTPMGEFEGWMDDFDQALTLLTTYSLVRIEKNELKMDPTLRIILQVESTQTGKGKTTLENLVKGVEPWIAINYLKYDKVRQILALWESVEKVDQLVKEYANIPVQLGDRLDELGMYPLHFKFCEDILERFEALFPDTNDEVMKMKASFGVACFRIGQKEEALKILEETYKQQINVLGDEAEDSFITAHSIAMVYSNLGRLDESVKMYEKILKGRNSLSAGKENEDICSTKHSLGEDLVRNGDVLKGMRMLEEVLDWRKSNLGEEHPDTLGTNYQLGWIHYDQGKLPQAKEIWEKVLKLEISVLGETHPETLATKDSLAAVFIKLGELETGVRMLKEVLPLRREVLGKDHPDTLDTQTWIEKYSKIL